MNWLAGLARVVFFFCLGMTLLLAPWGALWHENFVMVRYAWAYAVGHNYFLRGAISGLGLTNLWLAIDEIRRLGHLSDPTPMRLLR
jgi:hypothetical protein